MIKLYGRIGTGASVVEALMHELEVPHEYVNVEMHKEGDVVRASKEFLAINPQGQVPYIVCDDGTIMAESGAIVVAIADRFGRGKLVKHGLFIPEVDDPLSNPYARWMFFFASGVYYHSLFYFYSGRYVSSPHGQAELKTNALKELDRLLDFSIKEIGNQEYFLGDTCSPLDLYAAMLYSWHPDMAAFKKRQPAAIDFCKRVMTRPKSKKIWEKHELLQVVN